MWLKRHKFKLIGVMVILAVLTLMFWYGGNSPDSRGWELSNQSQNISSDVPESEEPLLNDDWVQSSLGAGSLDTSDSSAAVLDSAEPAAPELADAGNMALDDSPSAGDDGASESLDQPAPKPGDSVPGGNPETSESENVGDDDAFTCTISISCSAIVDNIDFLDGEKHELVPADGWILQAVTMTFYEGESVFHVLQRACRQNGIHLEFVNMPIYISAYIEGIGNLYESDAGELSGWMYKVNGLFPDYGCSSYQLQPDDVIEWVYTCDLGYDVGGGYATGNRGAEE